MLELFQREAVSDSSPTKIGSAASAIFSAFGVVWMGATLGACLPFLIEKGMFDPAFFEDNLKNQLRTVQFIGFLLALSGVQLSLASVMVWGVVPLLIHFTCFSSMLFNEAPKGISFLVSFFTQMVTAITLIIFLNSIK